MDGAAQSVKVAATLIAIAVVEHNDCFLIGQRPPGVMLAGYWEFPGGKIRDGEQPTDCAVRECLEETGMEVEVLRLLTECDYAYDYGLIHLQFFHCRPVDASHQPGPPFRWVERQELNRYTFPPANGELLKLLANDCVSPCPQS